MAWSCLSLILSVKIESGFSKPKPSKARAFRPSQSQHITKCGNYIQSKVMNAFLLIKIFSGSERQ